MDEVWFVADFKHNIVLFSGDKEEMEKVVSRLKRNCHTSLAKQEVK